MRAARFQRPVPIILGILFSTIANHAARNLLRFRPGRKLAVDFAATAGIGLDHTGVDGKTFPADQSRPHAPDHHLWRSVPRPLRRPQPRLPSTGAGAMSRASLRSMNIVSVELTHDAA
jgi:hypothetical protein